jgi:hypothetical protein
MSAYNAESTLARLLREHYPRANDEARARGSFFGALIALLPSHYSRTATVLAGVLIIDAGAAIGLLLTRWPLIALLVLFIGLFTAGMARPVSTGAYMGLLFAAIAVCAVGELARGTPDTSDQWLGLGAFVVGQVIVGACSCVALPNRSFADQRDATAELYRTPRSRNTQNRSVAAPTPKRCATDITEFFRTARNTFGRGLLSPPERWTLRPASSW